jgi:hypothetical protein
MKRALFMLTLAAAMLVSSVFAKDQPVYDLTGEISYAPYHSDSEAHVTP